MKPYTIAMVSRSIQLLLLILATAGLPVLGCTAPASGGLYAHGRIQVDEATRNRWDASEREVEAAGRKITPISDRDASTEIPAGSVSPEALRALAPSARHGAGDKRMLSVIDTSKGQRVVASSGIVGEVTLVKGSEYKSESDFRTGWLPLAIVVMPPRPERDPVLYPKLSLHGDTSWVYVRERKDATWSGVILRIVDGKVAQDPVKVTASTDDLEPVVGARFMWEDNDESIWGTCGGKCCKIVSLRSL